MVLSPRAKQNRKFQDKSEVENPFGQPYIDGHHELRQSTGDRPVVQLNSTCNNQKQWFGSNMNKDDELVKHMSNLPCYLQQVAGGEKLQKKALNFGVLDWEHLEKWKSNEKCIPARGSSEASSSSSSSSFRPIGSSTSSRTAQSKSVDPQRKQPTSHGFHLNLVYEERPSQGVRQSRGKVMHLQDFETVPRSTLDGQRNLLLKKKSSGRNYCERNLDRGKRKELDQMTTPEKETSSSDWRKHGLPLSSHDTMIRQDGETKMKEGQESNLAHQHCSSGHESIVLLVPKHSPKKICSESSQLSVSKTLFDGKLTEPNRKKISGCFYPEELHCVEVNSEIPPSCPLPVIVATHNESSMKPRSLINAQGIKLQSNATHMSHCANEIPIIPSKGKCLEEKKSCIGPSISTATETSKRFDQDITEKPAAEGRNPSPNRRFSFSLGKMTKSFSFKEDSAVPQLSTSYATVKSGPVRSEASAGLDNFNRDKENASSNARSSSPFRRLLDPLLKPKGSHSAKTAQPSKANLNSVPFKPMNTSELPQQKKHEASNVHALLQLIIKNGFPLFKLAVDSSSDILAAAVKKLPTSRKDDSSLIYVFYSVHEFKKKSGGWINQGSKERSSGFGYNIVGQMKVSSSHLPHSIDQNMKDHYEVRESVLYSVDRGQTDKETPEIMSNRELAAIVVKNPIEKNDVGSNHYRQKGFRQSLLEDTWENGECENPKSTIVILPGGIHGLPNKGVATPLITRWRSGGSCDCGGWDVGCKLQILTNRGQGKQSISCSTADHLDLFVQDGHQENKPIFSLAPFKNGLYSVEYNASISLLQAFSICVAAISSKKSSGICEVNNLLEAKCFPKPMAGSDTTIQGEIPTNYVSAPPPSPVGRI